MHLALTKLGYKVYHFKEIDQLDVGEDHISAWLEAFNTKMYGDGNPYNKADFDRLLRWYNVRSDATHTVSLNANELSGSH